MLDQIIIPRNSAFLKEKKGYVFSDLGHSSILFSKKVAKKIARWVK